MALHAVFSFLQGVEAYRRRAVGQLSGSPVVVKITYLGGHPGIWQREPFWAGVLADRLRLVDERGERYYDLPVERIAQISCDESGRLNVAFEPTAGLFTTVAFEAAEHSQADCRRLLDACRWGAQARSASPVTPG